MGAKKDKPFKATNAKGGQKSLGGANSAIVVGGPTRRRMSKKTAAVVLAVIIFIVAGCGALWYVYDNKSSEPPKTPATEHKDVLESVQKSQQERNFNQEATQLKAYLDSNPPKEYASQDIIRLAAAYVNAKDYDNAIKVLEESLSKYPENKLAAYRGLGLAYMLRGQNNGNNKDDYRKAIDYYSKAIKVAEADPNSAHIAGSDQTNIRYLQDKLQ